MLHPPPLPTILWHCSLIVQVPVTFHPRDPGMYTQMWDVNLHPATGGSRKIRLTLTAQVSHWRWSRTPSCWFRLQISSCLVSFPHPLPPGLPV